MFRLFGYRKGILGSNYHDQIISDTEISLLESGAEGWATTRIHHEKLNISSDQFKNYVS